LIFADTGALFAAFVPNDPDHSAADAWLATNTEPLVTTDYVVDALLTLLKIRGEFPRALLLGDKLLTEAIILIEWVSREDVLQA
jgi:predicted nucleic acid-binding protein